MGYFWPFLDDGRSHNGTIYTDTYRLTVWELYGNQQGRSEVEILWPICDISFIYCVNIENKLSLKRLVVITTATTNQLQWGFICNINKRRFIHQRNISQICHRIHISSACGNQNFLLRRVENRFTASIESAPEQFYLIVCRLLMQ